MDASEVDFHHLAELVACDLPQRRAAIDDAGVVEEKIGGVPGFLDHGFLKLGDLGFVGDVAALQQVDIAQFILKPCEGGLVPAAATNPPAFKGKAESHGAPQTFGSTGDDDGFHGGHLSRAVSSIPADLSSEAIAKVKPWRRLEEGKLLHLSLRFALGLSKPDDLGYLTTSFPDVCYPPDA